MSTADRAWLAEYERTHPNDFGRSASKTTETTYSHKETQAAAEGSGVAAMYAAAAMSSADGKRLDSILTIGVNALVEAVSCYKKMTAALLEERKADGETLRSMVESVRTHYLARTQAEAELIRREAEAMAKDVAGEDKKLEAALTEALVKQIMGGEGKQTPVNSSDADPR